jgi:predicted TIM-barrel fold metal-dependent hydrolase
VYLYDANCAIGTWPTDRPVYETVDGLLTEMARLGIERALVSHTLGRHYDPPRGNALLMQDIAGQDRLVPCWTLLPTSCGEMGTLEELFRGLAAAGVRAVRFYPRDHSYNLDDWQCGDLLGALSQRRYVVLLDLDQTNWPAVERICRTYPWLSLVLTQTGYRQLRPLFAALACCPNLYVDLSNFTTFLGVEEVLARFGSGRLLFGTGLPVGDPGGPIARVHYTRAPQADLEAMAHGNLERLLSRVVFTASGQAREVTA